MAISRVHPWRSSSMRDTSSPFTVLNCASHFGWVGGYLLKGCWRWTDGPVQWLMVMECRIPWKQWLKRNPKFSFQMVSHFYSHNCCVCKKDKTHPSRREDECVRPQMNISCCSFLLSALPTTLERGRLSVCIGRGGFNCKSTTFDLPIVEAWQAVNYVVVAGQKIWHGWK